jgi:hypothetical protein
MLKKGSNNLKSYMNKYIEFKESDLVWVILAREGSPQGKFSKLKPRIDGPFKVLQ